MILVDTSIWVDHLSAGDGVLASLLRHEQVLMHPHVVGELALGRIPDRALVLELLHGLPQAEAATDAEVFDFITAQKLEGSGIGYPDAHLLAAARLTPGASLWTRDRRLHVLVRRLGLDAGIEPFTGLQED